MDDKTKETRYAEASMEAMYRIFTVPEAPDSTLARIDKMISQNLIGFLQQHIVAVEKDLSVLEKDFSESRIPEKPIFVSDQADFLLNKLVAQSVHTASPSFIGHMTSALPHFMLPLSKIMMALNQNLVKIETSKAFTPLERQVLGMMHRLVYQNDDSFYEKWMHEADHSVGSFCSGGTLANLTALWLARSNLFKPTSDFPGVNQVGMHGALKHFGYDGLAILVSERGHYSISKAADVLGLGRNNLIAVKTDERSKIRLDDLQAKLGRLKEQNIKVLSIIGIAGTSETGSVDPLNDLADIAEEAGCHFHVDAAWGGPTLFSDTYKHILNGIERADSVTIDAHKQLYVPMGAGLVLFKDPRAVEGIAHHAEYIIRKGSKDLGSHTLEGSRAGMAMLLHSGLKIIGQSGYELLIDQGIEKARAFARQVDEDDEFELISEPELNIFTYRYVPVFVREALKKASAAKSGEINGILNLLTRHIQKTQRARGKSFVSRTRLAPKKYGFHPIIVFRVVLANPLTSLQILKDVLSEQREIASGESCEEFIEQLREVCQS